MKNRKVLYRTLIILSVSAVLFWSAAQAAEKKNPNTRGKSETVLEIKIEEGRLFLKAENMPLQKIFATLGAKYNIEIINGALIPATPQTMTLENISEKDGIMQLVRKARDLNHMVTMRKKPAENQSVFAKIGFFPIEGGTGENADGTAGSFVVEDYSTGAFDEGPHYIPPDEEPQYIPPEGEPQYIPPDEPPQYIPPDEPPKYIPPPDGKEMQPDNPDEGTAPDDSEGR